MLRFWSTMTGRVFAILFAGMVLSASLAIGLSTLERNYELRKLGNDQLAAIVVNFLSAYRGASEGMKAELVRSGVPQLRPLQHRPTSLAPAPELQRVMEYRLGVRLVSLSAADLGTCQFTPGRARPPSGCWVVTFRMPDGAVIIRALSERSEETDPLALISPYFLLVLFIASAGLALALARMLTAPLAQLSSAALAFGRDLDAGELPSRGPIEVRNASAAFETMRGRLKTMLFERTHMLGAIAHDLQTPLTRMRLKLDNASNPDLRRRLLADVDAMQALVRSGLDLAHSVEANEAELLLDIDSLLHSLAQDALDAGQSVTVTSLCEAQASVRPQSLARVLSNLIDNAVKFGGAAELGSHMDAGAIVITVRDRGSGIPEQSLQAVMQPYVRLEDSRSRKTGGTGLGLTIAKVLAAKSDAELKLRNHPDGGVEATVVLRAGVQPRMRTRVA